MNIKTVMKITRTVVSMLAGTGASVIATGTAAQFGGAYFKDSRLARMAFKIGCWGIGVAVGTEVHDCVDKRLKSYEDAYDALNQIVNAVRTAKQNAEVSQNE